MSSVIEKDYVLAKGCFADFMFIVVGGPLLFVALCLVALVGLYLWPLLLIAAVVAGWLHIRRVSTQQRGTELMKIGEAAQRELPTDMPETGEEWIVRRDAINFRAADKAMVLLWRQDGRVQLSDFVFDPQQRSWSLAADL